MLGPSRVERIELEFRLLSLPQCGGTLTLTTLTLTTRVPLRLYITGNVS